MPSAAHRAGQADAPGRIRAHSMPRLVPILLVTALLIVALLVTGCTRPQARLLPDLHQQVTAPIEGLRQHVTPKWSRDFSPASRPVIVGNTVLAYESRAEKNLELVGFDLRDGHQLFRIPASTGRIPAGSELSVTTATAGGIPVVVSLARPVLHKESNQYRHTIVISDPADGRKIREIDAGFVGHLGHCGQQVCVEIVDPRGAVSTTAINLETGEKAEPEQPAAPAPVMLAGTGAADGLFTRGSGADRTIGAMAAGEPQWELPAAEIFGSETVGDHLVARVDPVAQTAGLTARTVPGDENTVTAAEVTSVALDLGSGESLWKQQGFSFDCNTSGALLPCSGDLRWTRDTPGGPYLLRAEKLIMHGVEYGSGTEQWATEVVRPEPLTSAKAPADPDTPVNPETPADSDPSGGQGDPTMTAVAPADYWVWRADGKAFVGDTTTGGTTELDGSAWLACTSTVEFADAEFSNPTQRLVPFTTRVSQPCSVDGELTDSPAQFTVAGILAVSVPAPGEREDGVPGLYAVTLPHQLAVYQ